MIKKVISLTLLSITTTISLIACGNPQEKTEALISGQEEFLGEVSVVDGEVVTSPVNTSAKDTISIPIGKTVSLPDILSAMYGDNIEVRDIVCTKGVGEVNGDSVTVRGNAVIEFNLTYEGQTSHQTLKIIGTEE